MIRFPEMERGSFFVEINIAEREGNRYNKCKLNKTNSKSEVSYIVYGGEE